MPELPDVQIFCDNLKKKYAGRKITMLLIKDGRKLKDKPADLKKALEGKSIKDVYRSGKEIRILLSSGKIAGIHLMLTGDLIPFEGTNERKTTVLEIHFANEAIALTDRLKNAYLKLNPEDKEGIDAFDKALNFSYLKKICNRKTNIKNVLTNQELIRGIGNGYSDEILWQARISPFSVAKSIPDDKLRELARLIKSVLKSAIKKISKAYPNLMFGEVKEFLEIHTKKKTHSPTGHPILNTDRGMLKTYYTDEQIEYK